MKRKAEIRSYATAVEFKVIALRECPLPAEMASCDGAGTAVAYWRAHIETSVYFNPEVECLAVLLLNTRHKIKGHQMVTFGTMDRTLTHAREIFRSAVVGSAYAIIVIHNHPSGDPTPSSQDIYVTRTLKRAADVLGIELLDHVIVGNERHVSLRELGTLSD